MIGGGATGAGAAAGRYWVLWARPAKRDQGSGAIEVISRGRVSAACVGVIEGASAEGGFSTTGGVTLGRGRGPWRHDVHGAGRNRGCRRAC